MISSKTLKLAEEHKEIFNSKPDDIVSSEVFAPTNLKRLEDFLYNVQNKRKDYIRLVNFNDEKVTIVHRVHYDGDVIKVLGYIKDNSKNELTIRKYIGKRIKTEVKSRERIYHLMDENDNKIVVLYQHITLGNAYIGHGSLI